MSKFIVGSNSEVTTKVQPEARSASRETWRGPLRGIIPPVVTPLLDQVTLDVAGLERLIAHLLNGGVHGFFVLGTTGEGPSLSHEMRVEVVQRVARLMAGRVPLVVGITDTSFTESVTLAEQAADCGAAAVVIAPPYYYPPGQSELLEYLEHMLQALPLPALLYNLPALTKVSWAPETVRAAAEMPGVIGLKDSSGDLNYFRRVKELLSGFTDFTLMVGPEDLLAEALRMGAHGGVSGGANLFPKLFVKLYEAASRNDWVTVQTLHEHVMAVSNALYGVGSYSSSFLKGLKCALACRGICSDFLAEPFRAFATVERQCIEKALTLLMPQIEAAVSSNEGVDP